MSGSAPPDVVVVGGGAVGLASAWYAAKRDARVTVLDPHPGEGASYAAAGLLCPVTEAHYGEEPLLALTLESSRRWATFASELYEAAGLDVFYRRDGTLAVAFGDDDLRELEELFAFQESLGLPVERLRASECRELEPSLSPRVRGGVVVDGDHQVDNRALVRALQAACTRAGVNLERREVASLASDEALGRAGSVVVAAGCWSAALAPELPVRPVKGQILRLRFDPPATPLVHNVRGIAEGRPVYLAPRTHGELVVGATVEEKGFDTTVTAGAVFDLLGVATRLVPDVRELTMVEALAGLRPGTPDNAPIIGRSPLDPRVVYATGHYRNGILLTPVTADAVAALACGEKAPSVVAPFGIERFL